MAPYNNSLHVDDDSVLEKTGDWGNITSGELLSQGFHFFKLTSTKRQKKQFFIESDDAYISFVFCFNSTVCYKYDGANTVFAEILEYQNGLIFLCKRPFSIQWNCANNAELYIINITTSWFSKLLSEGNPLFESFTSSLNEQIPALLNEQALKTTPRMKYILKDMFQTDFEGHYRFIFLKSKLLELLLLHFKEYDQLLAAEQLPLLENGNLEKMYEARDIILSNLASPCSLMNLAQQVGTNECYLKKHFKQVFGTTVFGYMHKLRMERSKEILQNNNKKIAEVAKLSGYKHASHFTTAFKKFFGYLPHQINVLFCIIYGPYQAVISEINTSPIVALV